MNVYVHKNAPRVVIGDITYYGVWVDVFDDYVQLHMLGADNARFDIEKGDLQAWMQLVAHECGFVVLPVGTGSYEFTPAEGAS